MTTLTRPPAAIGVIRSALPRRPGHDSTIEVEVGYELAGDSSAPVVVVLGGISAGRHVAATSQDPRPGWWDAMVGPGLAIDTRRLRVLSIDWLGGAGTSSGPAAFAGVDGRPISVTTQDQAHAITAVLDHVGVNRAAAVIGASYGGMVALALAAMDHVRVDRAIVIAAAERSHPMATALRTLQRRIVRLGLKTGTAAAGSPSRFRRTRSCACQNRSTCTLSIRQRSRCRRRWLHLIRTLLCQRPSCARCTDSCRQPPAGSKSVPSMDTTHF